MTPDGGAPGITSRRRARRWSKVGTSRPRISTRTPLFAVDRHRLDDYAPYVYAPATAARLDAIDAGIARGRSSMSCARIPTARAALRGDRARHLRLLRRRRALATARQNLPMTSVRDIAVHGDDVVIATHGRGFWVLDDVTPLRQINGGARALTLFKPADAIRLKIPPFTGTPMPKDEPTAANPPAGARSTMSCRRISPARSARRARRRQKARAQLRQHRYGEKARCGDLALRAGMVAAGAGPRHNARHASLRLGPALRRRAGTGAWRTHGHRPVGTAGTLRAGSRRQWHHAAPAARRENRSARERRPTPPCGAPIGSRAVPKRRRERRRVPRRRRKSC